MNSDIFLRALHLAWHLDDPIIILSGGEPAEHPDIVRFIELATIIPFNTLNPVFKVIVLSNGKITANEKTLRQILGYGADIQVTHDKRFYPREYPKVDWSPQISYESTLRVVSPFGRAVTNKLETNRRAPHCFNIRSATKNIRDLPKALEMLRAKGHFCCPSIDYDGTVRMGETPFCAEIGTVDSSVLQLTRAMCSTRCQRCGLVNNLQGYEKEAIGE